MDDCWQRHRPRGIPFSRFHAQRRHFPDGAALGELAREGQERDAGYQTLLKAQIPNAELPDNAGTVRVIAGDYNGRKGAAKTFSPINLWDVNLRAGKSAELPLADGHTTTFLVLSGEVLVNGESKAGEGDLAIFERT